MTRGLTSAIYESAKFSFSLYFHHYKNQKISPDVYLFLLSYTLVKDLRSKSKILFPLLSCQIRQKDYK